MWVFVGLGNIGKEYVGTRHNIGFEVVDQLETKLTRSTGWKAGKGEYYFSKGMYQNEEVLLVKPTTFMNLSGRAVRDALQFYKVGRENLVVITDDIALPLGALRLRLRGSDGGHNGLKSIIYETASDEFARLRCGVGSEFRRGDQANYVLSQFKSGEQAEKDKMVEAAISGCLTIVQDGFERAMNKVNVGANPKIVKKNEKKEGAVNTPSNASEVTQDVDTKRNLH